VNFGPQTAKMGLEFLLTFRKFCILLHCQALHMANGTQPNFAKWEEVNGDDVSQEVLTCG